MLDLSKPLKADCGSDARYLGSINSLGPYIHVFAVKSRDNVHELVVIANVAGEQSPYMSLTPQRTKASISATGRRLIDF